MSQNGESPTVPPRRDRLFRKDVKLVSKNNEDVKEINNTCGYANDDEDMIDDLQDVGFHSENTGSSLKVSSTTFAR